MHCASDLLVVPFIRRGPSGSCSFPSSWGILTVTREPSVVLKGDLSSLLMDAVINTSSSMGTLGDMHMGCISAVQEPLGAERDPLSPGQSSWKRAWKRLGILLRLGDKRCCLIPGQHHWEVMAPGGLKCSGRTRNGWWAPNPGSRGTRQGRGNGTVLALPSHSSWWDLGCRESCHSQHNLS